MSEVLERGRRTRRLRGVARRLAVVPPHVPVARARRRAGLLRRVLRLPVHVRRQGGRGVARGDAAARRPAHRAGRCWWSTGRAPRTASWIQVAIEAVEAARALGARAVALTDTSAQRELLLSLGFGDALAGAVSLEELSRRLGHEFVAAGPLPAPAGFQGRGRGVQGGHPPLQRSDAQADRCGHRPVPADAGRSARPARLRLRARGPRRALAHDGARQAHGRPRRLLGEPRGPALHVLRAAGVDAAAAHPHAERRDPRHPPQHRARVRRR